MGFKNTTTVLMKLLSSQQMTGTNHFDALAWFHMAAPGDGRTPPVANKKTRQPFGCRVD
jgi:hypothetical protein